MTRVPYLTRMFSTLLDENKNFRSGPKPIVFGRWLSTGSQSPSRPSPTIRLPVRYTKDVDRSARRQIEMWVLFLHRFERSLFFRRIGDEQKNFRIQIVSDFQAHMGIARHVPVPHPAAGIRSNSLRDAGI